MKSLIILVLTLLSLFTNAAENEKVAKAIIVRNSVEVTEVGAPPRALSKDEWVKEGAVIKTGDKSFVKFLFIDKSQMNLGPNGHMDITQFPKKDAGIITLIKGQLRSKVTKNYMEIKEKEKSKLFIKTKTAAMGVRGTDFQVNYNPINENTSLVTFEGVVAMAQFTPENRVEAGGHRDLEKLVSSENAVLVKKGQFSGVTPSNGGQRPTIPVKLNPAQLKTLEKNVELSAQAKATDKAAPAKQFRSVIPPGVDSKQFAGEGKELAKQLAGTIGTSNVKNVISQVKFEKQKSQFAAAPPEGYVNSATGEIAPPAGGFIDLATAQYIPPPPGSTFDESTQTYIPPSSFGSFDPNTGGYVNKNFDLTYDGKFVPKVSALGPAASTRSPASIGDSKIGNEFLPPPPVISFGPIDNQGLQFNGPNFDTNREGGPLSPGDSPLAYNQNGDLGDFFNSDKIDDLVNEASEDANKTITDQIEKRTRVRFIIRSR